VLKELSKMTNRSTHSQEDEALAFGEASAPSSIRSAARADNVIQFIPRNAAAEWDDDAGEFDDTFESIGSLAVRLVASWQLPRLVVFVAADPEGGEPDRLP
jgi:hypothetical protein